jgi:hypothetical protein
MLRSTKKHPAVNKMVRDCLIVNLAWVHQVPLPNVAEDVGVCLRTVTNLLKNMRKPNFFEDKCLEFEKRWTRQQRSAFHLKKIVKDSTSMTTVDEIRSKLKRKEITLSRGQTLKILRQENYRWRSVLPI